MKRWVGVLTAAAALAATAAVSAQARPISGFFSFSLDLRTGTFAKTASGPAADVSYAGYTVVVAGKAITLPHPVNAVTASPDGRFVTAETYDASVCERGPPPPCGEFTLWLLNRDGSDLHVLSADARDAAWSRDSGRLAFVGNFQTATLSGRVSVVDADGTHRHVLGLREVAARPTWSADGTLLAYTRTDRESIRVVRVADHRSVALFSLAVRPTWAGSGRRLAFVRHGHVTLWSKAGVRVLATGSSPLAWSPDGNRIAFRRGGNVAAVGVVRADGGRTRTFRLPSLGSGRAEVTELLWQSPDDLFVAGLVPPGPFVR